MNNFIIRIFKLFIVRTTPLLCTEKFARSFSSAQLFQGISHSANILIEADFSISYKNVFYKCNYSETQWTTSLLVTTSVILPVTIRVASSCHCHCSPNKNTRVVLLPEIQFVPPTLVTSHYVTNDDDLVSLACYYSPPNRVIWFPDMNYREFRLYYSNVLHVTASTFLIKNCQHLLGSMIEKRQITVCHFFLSRQPCWAVGSAAEIIWREWEWAKDAILGVGGGGSCRQTDEQQNGLPFIRAHSSSRWSIGR
jgi:hypothetical protein